jgi:hypothetical protein
MAKSTISISMGGLLGDAMEMDRRKIRLTEPFLSIHGNRRCGGGGLKSPYQLLLVTLS